MVTVREHTWRNSIDGREGGFVRLPTARVRLVALGVAVAILTACGGEEASDPGAPPSSTGHGETETGDAHEGEHGGNYGAGETGSAEPDAGGGQSADVEDHEGHQLAEPLDPALAAVAARTASALSGTDWGLVWDLSCRALVGDQPREAYVASLAVAGTPGQLAGGTLTAGRPIDGAGVDAGELPLAEGVTRWVEIRSGVGIIGVARFVDAGEGFRYCGLSV